MSVGRGRKVGGDGRKVKGESGAVGGGRGDESGDKSRGARREMGVGGWYCRCGVGCAVFPRKAAELQSGMLSRTVPLAADETRAIPQGFVELQCPIGEGTTTSKNLKQYVHSNLFVSATPISFCCFGALESYEEPCGFILTNFRPFDFTEYQRTHRLMLDHCCFLLVA